MSSAGFAIGADTPTSADAAKSATCLSGPKGVAPQGERWFYRVERGTKKHCWYTRANTTRNVAARAPEPEPVDVTDETPSTSPQPAPLQPSVANARAEVVAPAFPPPPAVATPPANTMDVQPRTLADRLSDHPDANRPVQPENVTPLAPLAAAKPSPEDSGTSLGLLLVVIGGALALVGVAVGLITRFARPRTRIEPDGRWASTEWDHDEPETIAPIARDDDGPPTQWDSPPMNWVRVAREHADRHDDEIEHVLSRQARTG